MSHTHTCFVLHYSTGIVREILKWNWSLLLWTGFTPVDMWCVSCWLSLLQRACHYLMSYMLYCPAAPHWKFWAPGERSDIFRTKDRTNKNKAGCNIHFMRSMATLKPSSVQHLYLKKINFINPLMCKFIFHTFLHMKARNTHTPHTQGSKTCRSGEMLEIGSS